MTAATVPVALTRRTYPYVPDAALVDYRTARAAWDDWRRAHGYAPGRPLLSEPGDNLKMAKDGRVIFGISLAPARESGRNVCRNSTPECRALCLATAGSGRYANTQLARIMKTRFLWADPVSFVSLAVGELDRALHRWADVPRVGFRPNILSDLPWETIAPSLVAHRPRLRAYDYTKVWAREGTDRYRLTYSRSERTPDAAIVAAVESGRNVAVAFSTSVRQALPRTYLGCRVIDGDLSDYRPADPSGVIVGLRAKGRARQARYRTGGFVIDVRNLP